MHVLSPQQTQDAQAIQKIEKAAASNFVSCKSCDLISVLNAYKTLNRALCVTEGRYHPIRESSSGAIDRDERSAQRPIIKLNRLSPEERLALRRQIREARQDIYLRPASETKELTSIAPIVGRFKPRNILINMMSAPR